MEGKMEEKWVAGVDCGMIGVRDSVRVGRRGLG